MTETGLSMALSAMTQTHRRLPPFSRHAAQVCEQQGGAHHGVEVERLLFDDEKVNGTEYRTRGGELATLKRMRGGLCRMLVTAAGSALGLELPIYPIKGYSLTVPSATRTRPRPARSTTIT